MKIDNTNKLESFGKFLFFFNFNYIYRITINIGPVEKAEVKVRSLIH